jgi:hypothetical protein
MKKTFYILLILATPISGFSQSSKLSIDFSGGARFLGKTSGLTRTVPGIHFDIGIGYQLNENVALKGEVALDQYIAKDTASNATFKYDSGIKMTYLYDRSTLIRTSIYAVLNLGAIAGFQTEKFGMKTQIGVGLASNNNADFKSNYSKSFSDPGIKGNDDMFCASIALTPHYRINSQVSLIANLGYTLLAKQSHYVDRVVDPTQISGSDGLVYLSLGISSKLGK